jgi:hypothetical protein
MSLQKFVKKSMQDLIDNPVRGATVDSESFVFDNGAQWCCFFDVLIQPDESSPYCDKEWRVRLLWKSVFSERRIQFFDPIFSCVVHGGDDHNLVCGNELTYLKSEEMALVQARQMIEDTLRAVFCDPTGRLKSKFVPRLGKYVQLQCGRDEPKDVFFFAPARRAALCFLLSNKVERCFPKDVAKIIARLVYNTRLDPVWNPIGKELFFEKARFETRRLVQNREE